VRHQRQIVTGVRHIGIGLIVPGLVFEHA
jgi:hypothetical protein